LNIKEKVLEYIDNCDNNEPIFMDDIKKYVIINMDKDIEIKQINNNINVIIHRLLKDNKLKTNIEVYIINKLKHYSERLQ